MNINQIMYFKIKNQYFAINAKNCLKVIPNTNTIDNDLLNINNIEDFFYFNNEVLPLFDLSKILNADTSKEKYIIVVIIENRKIGLQIAFDSIKMLYIDDENIQIIDSKEQNEYIENHISYIIKDVDKDITIDILDIENMGY